MTPKEQAIILFNKFMEMPYPTHRDRAKHCTLIAVDEMLDFRNNLYINEDSLAHQYLIEVKQEIEKL